MGERGLLSLLTVNCECMKEGGGCDLERTLKNSTILQSIVWTLMGKGKKLDSFPFSPCQQHSSCLFSLTPPIIIIMCAIFIKL